MMLHAFAKFAKVVTVNSPFLITVMMSSINLSNNVDTKCFFLTPDCVGLYYSWFSINSIICFRTNFLYIFDSTGNTDISLQLESCFGVQIFRIGLILAIFHRSGNISFWMKLLIITTSWITVHHGTYLSNCIGVLASPVGQSIRAVFNSFCFVDADFMNFETVWISVF